MFMSNVPVDPGDEKYVPTGFADALVAFKTISF